MREKPYNLLLWTGVILILTSLILLKKDSIIDIHLHDTYFVVDIRYVFWFLAILSLFVWILYFLTHKILYSKAFTWIHIIVTILTLMSISSILYYVGNISTSEFRHLYDFSSWEVIKSYNQYTKAIAISLSVLILGQVIFIVNFTTGLFRRRN